MNGPSTLSVRSFADDESSVECIAGWHLRCLQVSTGVLAGESIDLHLPMIQLLFETYRNVTTSHCGTAPDSAVVFGIAMSMAGDGRFNGRPWGDGITAFDSRQELISLAPPVELITLVVDRQLLHEHARITEHVDLTHWLAQGPIMVNDATLAHRVVQQLQTMKAACIRRQLSTAGETSQQQLSDELLGLLCPLVVQRLRPPAAARRELPELEVVRRARDRLLQRAGEPPRIIDLCRDLGVSRRWLQWSFNEVLGISPWAYLQLMRLNGARRMLLRATPGRKVSDAVEAFGFWHLSRFSRDYRHQFGELPSHTLQRALARC